MYVYALPIHFAVHNTVNQLYPKKISKWKKILKKIKVQSRGKEMKYMMEAMSFNKLLNKYSIVKL